jgi:predicted nucleic acid-binding protein
LAEAVVNASPLIYLSAAGHLDLLRIAAAEVVVPEAVAREVHRWGADDPAARALATTSWLKAVSDATLPPSVQAWDLGAGESAVIAWALSHPGATAIVDDLAARRCAVTLGVPVRGTLGLVLVARRRGRIPSARQVIRELREAGMYLSEAVADKALGLVGE